MSSIPLLLRPLVDFALPPRCAGCGQIVDDDHQLCVICWQSLDFLSGEGCSLCGTPLPPTAQVCAPCLQHPPAHDGVRAAVRYGDTARKIILSLKHGRRMGLAQLVAKAMKRNLPDDPAVLIPVPLHRWRIWRRGFNQSALIAAYLAQNSRHKLMRDGLRRIKQTPVLGGLGAKDRAAAVRGAFVVNPECRPHLKGKTILLIDDVYTSGATVNACALALKRAGTAKVIALCWARVLIDP